MHPNQTNQQPNDIILLCNNKKAIETASSNLRNSLKGTDIEDIKKKTQELVQASMKMGEAIYKSQQSAKPGDTAKDKKQEGKKDAAWTSWWDYERTRKEMKGAYRNGKMVDKWFFYDKNGNLKEIRYFSPDF